MEHLRKKLLPLDSSRPRSSRDQGWSDSWSLVFAASAAFERLRQRIEWRCVEKDIGSLVRMRYRMTLG